MTKATEAITKQSRIVFVTTWRADTSTGGVRYNREVADFLEKAGWVVQRLVLPAEGDGGIISRHWSSNWWLARRLLRECREDAVVVLDAAFSTRAIMPALLVRLLGRGHVACICHHLAHHDLDPRWWKRFLDRLIGVAYLRLAHQIITVSEANRSELMRAGISSQHITVVPDGVEESTSSIGARNPSDGLFRILFVGTCYPRKGLMYLLEAVSILKGKLNLKLDIVGDMQLDPDYSGKLHSVVREELLQDCVEFHGWVSQGRLWELYAGADVFVLPSLWEGFGIVLLEAMAFGLPIVATNAGAIPELIRHGENGLLVPPADAPALAEAILKLHDNESLRSKLSKASLDRSRESLSWKQVGQQFEAALEALVGRS